MNALLLCLGIAWIGFAILLEAAPVWDILRAANPIQNGWVRINDTSGPYNFHMLFEPFVFVPGLAVLAWRQNRMAKGVTR